MKAEVRDARSGLRLSFSSSVQATCIDSEQYILQFRNLELREEPYHQRHNSSPSHEYHS